MAEYADLHEPGDLTDVDQLNPASEAGQRQIRQLCLAEARRFLGETEGLTARHCDGAERWVALFLAEGIIQGMAASAAELNADDAEEILLHVMPAHALMAEVRASEVVTVLQDFWRYLGRTYKFPYAGLIVSTLGALKPRFAAALESQLESRQNDALEEADPVQQALPSARSVWTPSVSAAEAIRKKKRRLARAARKANKKKK